MQTFQTRSSPIAEALRTSWAAVRSVHPEIPSGCVVLEPASSGPLADAVRIGCATRWRRLDAGDDEFPSLEVVVSGDRLRSGSIGILSTVLHEAAHVLAHVRGVRDTSRQGRYHNEGFRRAADELGLDVARSHRFGWSTTAVPPHTSAEYAETVAALDESLRWWHLAESGPELPEVGVWADHVRLSCDCRRVVEVTTEVLALGPIVCGRCGQRFREFDADVAREHTGSVSGGRA